MAIDAPMNDDYIPSKTRITVKDSSQKIIEKHTRRKKASYFVQIAATIAMIAGIYKGIRSFNPTDYSKEMNQYLNSIDQAKNVFEDGKVTRKEFSDLEKVTDNYFFDKHSSSNRTYRSTLYHAKGMGLEYSENGAVYDELKENMDMLHNEALILSNNGIVDTLNEKEAKNQNRKEFAAIGALSLFSIGLLNIPGSSYREDQDEKMRLAKMNVKQ